MDIKIQISQNRP
ncbi:hypothetical protein EC950183_5079, partial [Escherichia coli 95.0183]